VAAVKNAKLVYNKRNSAVKFIIVVLRKG